MLGFAAGLVIRDSQLNYYFFFSTVGSERSNNLNTLLERWEMGMANFSLFTYNVYYCNYFDD